MALSTLAGVALATAGAVASVGEFDEQFDRSDLRLGVEGVTTRVETLAAYLSQRHQDLASGPSGVAQGLSGFWRYVQRCTNPEDRFFISFFYPDVYVAAGRGFAGGQVFLMNPFYTSTEDQQRVLDRMRRESVPFMLLVLDRESSFRQSYPLLSAHFDADYEVMTEVAVPETRGVRVFVDKSRPAAGIDPQTQWRCFR